MESYNVRMPRLLFLLILQVATLRNAGISVHDSSYFDLRCQGTSPRLLIDV